MILAVDRICSDPVGRRLQAQCAGRLAVPILAATNPRRGLPPGIHHGTECSNVRPLGMPDRPRQGRLAAAPSSRANSPEAIVIAQPTTLAGFHHVIDDASWISHGRAGHRSGRDAAGRGAQRSTRAARPVVRSTTTGPTSSSGRSARALASFPIHSVARQATWQGDHGLPG